MRENTKKKGLKKSEDRRVGSRTGGSDPQAKGRNDYDKEAKRERAQRGRQEHQREHQGGNSKSSMQRIREKLEHYDAVGDYKWIMYERMGFS